MGERAWYPQISATRPSETASASGSRAHRLSAGQLPNAVARHPAAVGSPHGNCERKDQVIVLAGSGTTPLSDFAHFGPVFRLGLHRQPVSCVEVLC